MNRRAFLLGTGATAALAASPAHADYVESVRAQLQKQGYRQISVGSTLLGRSRIVAKSGKGTREIIMNPRTGEILRDLWSSAKGNDGPSIVGSDDDERDDDGGDDGDKGRGRGGDDDKGGSDGHGGDGGDGEGGDGDGGGGDD